MQGEVIAVNTAIVSPTGGSVGIGFAVPSEIAMRVVDDLRRKGRIDRGWLGVSVREARPHADGVPIAGVDRSSPAGRAGLQPGDVITEVNGDKVETSTGLVRSIAGIAPGGTARLSVRRGGETFDIPISVGRRPAEPEE